MKSNCQSFFSSKDIARGVIGKKKEEKGRQKIRVNDFQIPAIPFFTTPGLVDSLFVTCDSRPAKLFLKYTFHP
jgi:hypothetical protein